MQELYTNALAHSQRKLPQAGDIDEVMEKLISEIAQGNQQATLFKQKTSQASAAQGVLQDKARVQDVKSFLLANNTTDVKKHPAFAACMSRIRSAFCQCATGDDWNPSTSCDFHDSTHTLPDLIWGLSKVMEREAVIPQSVPVVAAAALKLVMDVADKVEAEQGSAAAATSQSPRRQAAATKAAKTQDQPEDRFAHVESLTVWRCSA